MTLDEFLTQYAGDGDVNVAKLRRLPAFKQLSQRDRLLVARGALHELREAQEQQRLASLLIALGNNVNLRNSFRHDKERILDQFGISERHKKMMADGQLNVGSDPLKVGVSSKLQLSADMREDDHGAMQAELKAMIEKKILPRYALYSSFIHHY